ncbi:unnamed protein product [Symbiodinium natans]|uniref:FCP1 homology domain-containing protein n=1 Tax=Symbiodinium natans TaxID=878477 RepID=A0A812TZM6_9DINO|nr:unnamed protein product [Symbiodinium natans]
MPCVAIGARDEEPDEHAEEASQDQLEPEDENEDETELPAPPRKPPHLRVLFTDIEGVLGPRPDARLLTVQTSQCVFLRRLLQRTGAQLVLTSAWRRHRTYVVEVLDNFGVFDTFDGSGGSGSKPGKSDSVDSVGFTPFNADASRRDLEILQWLNSHRGEVASWAVLDTRDLLGFASAPRLQGHVIQVDGEKGLQPEHVDAAVAILGELPEGCAEDPSAVAPPVPAVPPAPPVSASSSSSPFAHIPMDEGLASMMQDALALLSTLPEGPAFQPPQRSKELRCAPDTEFDAISLQAKHKFA